MDAERLLRPPFLGCFISRNLEMDLLLLRALHWELRLLPHCDKAAVPKPDEEPRFSAVRLKGHFKDHTRATGREGRGGDMGEGRGAAATQRTGETEQHLNLSLLARCLSHALNTSRFQPMPSSSAPAPYVFTSSPEFPCPQPSHLALHSPPFPLTCWWPESPTLL